MKSREFQKGKKNVLYPKPFVSFKHVQTFFVRLRGYARYVLYRGIKRVSTCYMKRYRFGFYI